jgi:hypothetical protein
MTEVQGFTGAALQDAINALNGGGTLWIPKGVYNFGTTGVKIAQSQHRVQLMCESGTVFWYQGPGPALQIGGDADDTEGFRMSGCEVSLAGNPHDDAICIRMVRTFWSTLQDIRLVSDGGAPNPRQYGLIIGGGTTDEAGFAAYTVVINMAAIGSFKYCAALGSGIAGGPSTGDRANSNVFIGGSVYCGAQNRAGSVGIYIAHGDTNRIWGVDHDSLEVGTLVNGHANQVNARYENIDKYAIQIGPNSMGSFVFGSAVPLDEWLDEGYETQYILTSQGGVNKSMLTDMQSRYSTRLMPRSGDPPDIADGMAWYDADSHTIKVRVNGVTRTLAVQ